MNCPKCGSQNDDDAKLCYRCYTPLKVSQFSKLKSLPEANIPRQSKPQKFQNLIRCKDCGKEVSKSADKCPHCGAPIKKTFERPRGCLFNIILVFFILIIAGILIERGSHKPQEGLKQERKELKEPKRPVAVRVGESVRVGEMSYIVNETWWSGKLSDNPLLNQKPDAWFFFIHLSVRNDGKEPRTIPSFKLIDSRGREHGTSDKAWRVKDALGSNSLNPGVTKSGIIVFDVNQIENYKLKITGGLWSSEYALVEIPYKW